MPRTFFRAGVLEGCEFFLYALLVYVSSRVGIEMLEIEYYFILRVKVNAYDEKGKNIRNRICSMLFPLKKQIMFALIRDKSTSFYLQKHVTTKDGLIFIGKISAILLMMFSILSSVPDSF